MKLIKIQKYVWDLQALKEFVKNHTKIFTSLPDIIERLQIQKKVWDIQALQESFESNTKILQGC